MANIPLLTSSATYSEASQIIGTINSLINSINTNALIGSTAQTSLRNAVIGGDFGVNPWQRTTSITSVTNTLTYTADRFWALGGASSSITVSRQTGTPVPGFAAHARFQRASANADTTAIKFGQVFTSAASTRFQGQPFTLSFWARAGAGFSAAGNALGVSVGTGTGANESASNFAAGSWTTYTTVNLTSQAGLVTTAITLTTSFARYSMAGFVPLTATQLGFNFVYTPVGTATTTDYAEIAGVQLEVTPAGGNNPSPFEWRPAPLELALCQHYFYRLYEPVATTKLLMGQANTTTQATVLVPFPVQMRVAPTTSVTTTTIVIGSFALTAAAGATTSSLTNPTNVTTSSPTTEYMNLTCTLAAAGLVAGNVTYLIGGGGVGMISADAELL